MAFISFEQVTATDSIKSSSDLTIPAAANFAMLQADTENVKFTLDGSTHPSYGKRLIVGLVPEEIKISDLKNIRFIRESASNGNINIHYGT